MTVHFRCSRQDCRPDRCPAKEIFSCLSAAQDAKLGRERLARCYEADEVVVHHETPALAVVCVRSGKVKLVRYASNGVEVVVSVRGPGGMLGAWEVLSGSPYQVSVATMEPSVLCVVPREAFLEAVRDCPALAMKLLGQLARDHLVVEEQLVVRASLGVEARTARLLLGLAGEYPIVNSESSPGGISMSREKMALLVGTTRETLSRSLAHLAGRGAIALEEGSIRILAPGILQNLAD